MSVLENPTERLKEEPVESYVEIGKLAKLSKSEACRAAHDAVDPLPCWIYRGRVLAYPSAVREWCARQMLPVKLAKKIRGIGRSGPKRNHGDGERRKPGKDAEP